VIQVSSRALRAGPQRTQDIARAKKLLAEAGHPRGLQVELVVGDFLESSSYAVLLKQQAKKAGIDVKLNIDDTSVYYGSGQNQPWLTVPFGMTPWGERGVPTQLAAQAYQCGGVWNSAHWCNRKFTSLVNQLSSELDEGKRQTIAAKAAAIDNQDTSVILAYWIGQLRAVRKNLHGLAAGPSSHVDPRGMWLS